MFQKIVVLVVAVVLLVGISAVPTVAEAEVLEVPLCLDIFGQSIDERMNLYLGTLMEYGPAIGNAMASSGPVSVVSAVRSAGDGSVHIVWSLAARWVVTGDYPWFGPVPYHNGWCMGGPCGEGQKVTLIVEHVPCL